MPFGIGNETHAAVAVDPNQVFLAQNWKPYENEAERLDVGGMVECKVWDGVADGISTINVCAPSIQMPFGIADEAYRASAWGYFVDGSAFGSLAFPALPHPEASLWPAHNPFFDPIRNSWSVVNEFLENSCTVALSLSTDMFRAIWTPSAGLSWKQPHRNLPQGPSLGGRPYLIPVYRRESLEALAEDQVIHLEPIALARDHRALNVLTAIVRGAVALDGNIWERWSFTVRTRWSLMRSSRDCAFSWLGSNAIPSFA